MNDGASVRGRGRPPRTDEERARQRARLIDGAMEAIRGHGPDTSLVHMARAAGVTKPVLYAEFGDKQGVADAIALVLADQVERQLLDHLRRSDGLDVGEAVTAIVEALLDLIDGEAELYAFLVRSIRTSDRGLLDNALVRTVHDRAALLIGAVAPGVDPDVLTILTDAVIGLVFGAVESWQAGKVVPKPVLVRTLSALIRAGLAELADQRLPAPPGGGRADSR